MLFCKLLILLWNRAGTLLSEKFTQPRARRTKKGSVSLRAGQRVVSDRGDVIYIHGRTGLYLELAAGQPRLNVLDMAREAIFLDRALSIKRYAEQARRLVNLIQTDVGRQLAHLVANLNYDTLVADGREVLRTLVFEQSEVQTREGQWYLAESCIIAQLTT